MVELDRGDMEQFANSHTGNNEKETGGAWATFASWDKLLLIFAGISLLSALAALFVLLTPLLDIILNFMGLHYAGWIEWKDWIMGTDSGLAIVVALGLNALLFALLARFRVRRDWSVYAEAGCPQCHEHELIRVHRNRRDRALSFVGVPVRRYSCRNCIWHGVRLAGYRYPKKADEIEDRMIETETEPLEEAITSAKPLTEPALAGEIMVTEVSVEDPAAFDSVELAEQPFEFVKAEAIENVVNEEELASLMPAGEASVAMELNDELTGGETEADTLLEPGSENDEAQPERQEDMADNEAGSEVSDEDDEFARLCLEVAQSKL